MALVYLAEIEHRPSLTGTLQTLGFCSGRGYNDPSAPRYYDPRITQPANFRRDIFSAGRTGGRSTIGWGALEVNNLDGKYDYLLTAGFAGFKFRLLIGDHRAAYTDFTVVLEGTLEQCIPDLEKITFRIRDKQELFDVKLQDQYFKGTNVGQNGLEGDDTQQGQPKPISIGEPDNVTAKVANSSLLIYQAMVGQGDYTAVRDRGAALTKAGTYYATEAEMLVPGNQPTAGQFKVHQATGRFRLALSPSGTITCDPVAGAAATAFYNPRSLGNSIRTLVRKKLVDLGVDWGWNLAIPRNDVGMASGRGSHGRYFDPEGRERLADHNLFTFSQDLTNAVYTKTNVTISAVADIAAPDGTYTLQKVVETTANGEHTIQRAVQGCIAGERYGVSFYMRGEERLRVRVNVGGAPFSTNADSANAGTDILFGTDGDADTIVTNGANYVTGHEQAVGGFRRFTVHVRANSDGDGFIRIKLCSDLTGTTSYTGVSTSGLYLWGFQHEISDPVLMPDVFDYIPTLGAALYLARVQHDPNTGEPLGNLTEVTTTNNFVWSGDFAKSNWLTYGIERDDTLRPLRPDLRARTRVFREATNTPTHYINQSVSLTSVGTHCAYYTLHNYSGQRYYGITITASGLRYRAVFDLLTMTAQPVERVSNVPMEGLCGIEVIPASPVDGYDGRTWFRLWCNFVSTATNTFTIQLDMLDDNGSSTYNGSADRITWLSQAQLEPGNKPTSWIETYGVKAVRYADDMSANLALIGSAWTGTAGTIVVEGTYTQDIVGVHQPALSIGSATAGLLFYRNAATGNMTVGVSIGGGDTLSLNISTKIEDGQTFKMALRFNSTSFALSVNGSAPATGTTPSGLTISSGSFKPGTSWARNGMSPASDVITRFVGFYARQLTDAEMQQCTGEDWDFLHDDFGEVIGADITSADAWTKQSSIGYFTDSDVTYIDTLDVIAQAAGFWWGFDRRGRFRLQRINFPLSGPVCTFSKYNAKNYKTADDGDILELSFITSNDDSRGIPAKSVKLNYQRNYTVQDDVAGSVSVKLRGFLKDEYRNVIKTDEAILSMYPTADVSEFVSILKSIKAASLELDRLYEIYGKRHDRLRVKVLYGPRTAKLVDLGRTVRLRVNRFGMNRGRLFVVTGMQYDAKTNTCDLDLWG